MFQVTPPAPGRSGKDDPILRSGKTMPFASPSTTSLLYFAALLFFGVPFWISVLLPLAILSLPYHFFRKKKPMAQAQCLDPQHPLLQQATTRSRQHYQQHGSQSPRKYQVVIFGATGFTGRLAAVYLAKRYSQAEEEDFRWAIAGRSRGKLEKLQAELIQHAQETNNAQLQVDIIVADSFQAETLASVVEDTAAVVNMAGPFAAFAGPLVQLCAAFGTHYADITGEVFFVSEMIDRFDDLAQETGAKIVHMCGHDCIPWSLGVYLVAKKLKGRGESLQNAQTYSLIKGAVSGGTLRTMFESLEWPKYRPALRFNPMVKDAQGQKSNFKTRFSNSTHLWFDRALKVFTGPFVMSPVLARCVVRDNVLQKYGESLTYGDQTVYASFLAGFVQFFGLVLGGTAMVCPPLQWFARKFVLPKAGEGPSSSSMEQGFLKVVTIGQGSKGSTVRSTFFCDADPGYYYTSIMAVESGLALASNPANPDGVQGGGVLTPAGVAEPIMQRLRGALMQLEVQD